MRLILIILLLFSCGFSSEIHSGRSFHPLIEKIGHIPEGKELIERALRDGDIYVTENRRLSKQFEGYWEGETRTIHLTISRSTSETDLLLTLLFELHNATRERDFEALDRRASKGLLTKKEYIRAFELIEYENVLSAGKIIEIGKQKGIFPPHCRWDYSNSFEKHLAVQYSSGHSAHVGKIYDYVRG